MDTFLTTVLALAQLVLGLMGIYVALRPPEKGQHRAWIWSFVGVGLLGVALTLWMARRSSNAQEAANEKISQALTAATSANTAATNANNAVIAEQKEVKSARDDEKAAYDQLSRLVAITSGQVTGGDTVCYFEIPGEQIPLSMLSLRKRGSLPLYDVTAMLWIGHPFGSGVAQNRLLRLGNIPAGERPSFLNFQLDAYDFLKDQREVEFIVAFNAKNGSWHEIMYARRMAETGAGGRWLKAIRVYRVEFNKPYKQRLALIFERIDDGFPLKEVDWYDWLLGTPGI